VRIHNQTGPGLIRSVLCPGLGTAIGRMDPQACAQQMYSAYRISHAGQSLAFDDLMAACRDHVDLVHGATRRGSAPKAEA
jgi:hypothetical protein